MVVSNTSPLLALHRVGMLWLLPEVFDEQLVTTEAVAEEIETSRALGYEAPELAALSWLAIRPATVSKS
ncbi:MAG: hypothetical protein AB7S38_43285 [Vulcanimicrobiota bacterium]